MHTWKESDLRWKGKGLILMSTPPPVYNLEKKERELRLCGHTQEFFVFFSLQIGMRDAWGKLASVQTHDKSEKGCCFVCELKFSCFIWIRIGRISFALILFDHSFLSQELGFPFGKWNLRIQKNMWRNNQILFLIYLGLKNIFKCKQWSSQQ